MFDATTHNPDDERMREHEKVLNRYKTYIAERRDSLLDKFGSEDVLYNDAFEFRQFMSARLIYCDLSKLDLTEIRNRIYDFLSRPNAEERQKAYAFYQRSPYLMYLYEPFQSIVRGYSRIQILEEHLYPLASLFLEYGIDPDVTSRGKNTPLMMAARFNHKRMATLLLDNGADPNKVNKVNNNGWTPLIRAVKTSYDMVSLLLERGADVHHNEEERFKLDTAIGQAIAHGKPRTVSLLIEKGAKVGTGSMTAFMKYVHPSKSSEAFEIASLLLEHGADPNEMTSRLNSWRKNLLMFAAMHGNKEIVELLLEKYADSISINAISEGKHSWTALMFASNRGNAEIVALLLKHGADASIVDYTTSKSALMLAEDSGYNDIVDMLRRSTM